MKTKKIAVVLSMALLVVSLAGCGGEEEEPFYKDKTRAELIETCDSYINAASEWEQKYNDLYKMYNGIQSENKPTEAIGITGDGTGRFTFNSVDHKIIFPTELTYPGSSTITANGNMNVVSNVSITPGSNWVTKSGTASVEFEHISGISGSIKAGTQYFVYTANELREKTMKPWFETLPMSNITYTDISIAGQPLGCQAVSTTIIDGQPAMIRVGIMALGNTSVTYSFVYRGEQDASKDEIITLMMNTLQINGSPIIVEQ